jgi:stage II sporulation protein R
MKNKSIIFALITIIILLGATFYLQKGTAKTEYLRLHIRANSNSEVDQAIKYDIKSAVVEYLAPLVSEITTKSQAESVINSHLGELASVCDKVLSAKGFSYKSRVEYKREYFPTRVYDETELSAGVYDALIISLGDGTGDNWWCVVYPPLCFTDYGTDFVYKSKIVEIINEFKKRRDK